MTGIAPGADAWHATARSIDLELAKIELAMKAGGLAFRQLRARAEAAEAELADLRHQLEIALQLPLGYEQRAERDRKRAEAAEALAAEYGAKRQSAVAEIERLRSEVAQLRAEDQATHYLLAEAEQGGCPSCVLLEAEVARLREQSASPWPRCTCGSTRWECAYCANDVGSWGELDEWAAALRADPDYEPPNPDEAARRAYDYADRAAIAEAERDAALARLGKAMRAVRAAQALDVDDGGPFDRPRRLDCPCVKCVEWREAQAALDDEVQP